MQWLEQFMNQIHVAILQAMLMDYQCNMLEQPYQCNRKNANKHILVAYLVAFSWMTKWIYWSYSICKLLVSEEVELKLICLYCYNYPSLSISKKKCHGNCDYWLVKKTYHWPPGTYASHSIALHPARVWDLGGSKACAWGPTHNPHCPHLVMQTACGLVFPFLMIYFL